MAIAYLAALDAASNVFDIGVSVSCFSREAVLPISLRLGKRGWFGVLEAFLAACDAGCFDRVNDGGALGRNFDVFLVAAEEDSYGDYDSTDEM
jgi:hypothetical protein